MVKQRSLIGSQRGTAMPKCKSEPRQEADDPKQYRRFLETAREVGADEPGKDLDRVFDKVAERAPKPAKPPRLKLSRRS